jgi:hypothetical protein
MKFSAHAIRTLAPKMSCESSIDFVSALQGARPTDALSVATSMLLTSRHHSSAAAGEGRLFSPLISSRCVSSVGCSPRGNFIAGI